MNDLISRKALIAEYDRVHIGPPGGARKLMEDAPAVQQWIPVTERLPEEEDADEHDCVLVHTSNRDNLIVAREAVWKCTEFVTHWQPLHEPPKGE